MSGKSDFYAGGPTNLQIMLVRGEMRLRFFEEVIAYKEIGKWRFVLALRNVEAYRYVKDTRTPPVFKARFTSFAGMRRAGQRLRKKMDEHLAAQAAAS